VAAEHLAILAAVEAGDQAAAAEHLAGHLRAAQDRLVARLTRDEQPHEPPRVDA
jgi:DNA-binding GntR family transcriptional regulator